VNIIDALLGEHGMLYVQLDHIEQAVSTMESLDLVKIEANALAANLQSHLTLEDELLCARLESCLKRQPPAVGCEISHEEIDRGFAQLWAAENLETARGHFLGIVGLARRHSFGQEQVLFPLARRMLNGEILDVLGGEWAKRRGVVQQADA
jgi:hemerythrin-like domain-containing protein